MRGSGTFLTTRLKVTAPHLTATADFAGSLQTESNLLATRFHPFFNPDPNSPGGCLQVGLALSSPHTAAGVLRPLRERESAVLVMALLATHAFWAPGSWALAQTRSLTRTTRRERPARDL